MRDDWILDVLTDLETFAEQNGMPFLARSIEETRRLAEVELSLREPGNGEASPRALPIERNSREGLEG